MTTGHAPTPEGLSEGAPTLDGHHGFPSLSPATQKDGCTLPFSFPHGHWMTFDKSLNR